MKRAIGLLILALITSFLTSLPAQAFNQPAAVITLRNFVGAGISKLYEGRDELGECRVMIYSQSSSQGLQVWLEGTFQTKSGPTLGIVIPFMLSTLPTESRLMAFSALGNNLTADVILPSERGQIRMILSVVKNADGNPGIVSYRLQNTARSCQGLRRIL